MTTAAPAASSEIALLRHQAGMVNVVLRINVAGVTQEESLLHPEPGGNCLNWVVGHLLWAYNNTVQFLGQEPVVEAGRLDRYARGCAPITDAAEALDLDELMAAWDKAGARIDAGLAALPPERLDEHAPDSPTNNPDETVRTLLSTIMFHQAYHIGQTGVLRRVIGKEGAIK